MPAKCKTYFRFKMGQMWAKKKVVDVNCKYVWFTWIRRTNEKMVADGLISQTS